MGRLLLYDPLIMGHHLVYAENFTEWGLSRGFEVHFLGIHYQGSLFHRRFSGHSRVRFHDFDTGRFAHRANFEALVGEHGETGFYYDKLRTILFDDDGPAVQAAALRDVQARLKPDLTLVLYGDEMWDQWEAMVGRGEAFPRPTYLWLLYASGLRYDPYGLHARDLTDFLARQRLFAAVATSDEYQAAALDTPQGALRYVSDPYRRLGPAEELSDEESERLAALRAFLESGDGPVLLVPGLLEARKNASWLFDAIEAHDELSVVALGRRNLPPDEDQRAERLFAGLSERGRFFGLADYVPDAFLEVAMQSPRVRILPLPYRRHDISSGIQLMALRAGLPCLVPDNGLVARRTLEHGLGEVFAHESARDFARAANALVDYSREERAPACRAFERHFSREAFFAGADRFFGLDAQSGPDPLIFDAARRNQALLQAEPHGPGASAWNLQKALTLREASRREEALACLDKAASLAPEATKPIYLRATLLEEAGRVDLGRPLLETLCKARPDHPDVKAWIDAQSDLVVKRLAESGERVEHLAGLARDLDRGAVFAALLQVLSDRVWYHIHRGRHEKAQAILFDVLKVAPGTRLAISVLALNRLWAGPDLGLAVDWNELETSLREALRHAPGDEALLRARIEVLVHEGRFDEAAEVFSSLDGAQASAEEEERAAPASREERICRGYARLDRLHEGEPDSPDLAAWTEGVCDHVIDHAGPENHVRLALDLLRRRLGRKYFSALVDVVSDRVWFHIHRGRHEMAQAILLDVLAAVPGARLAVSILALNRLEAGASPGLAVPWDQLEATLQDALRNDPVDENLLRTRIEVLLHEGRFDEAAETFLRLDAAGGASETGGDVVHASRDERVRQGYERLNRRHEREPGSPDLSAWISAVGDYVISGDGSQTHAQNALAHLGERLEHNFFTALVDAVSDRVWLHIDRGAHDQAEALLRGVSAAAPHCFSARYILAMNRLRANRSQAALEAFRDLESRLNAALDANPDDMAVLRQRALVWWQSGNLEKAAQAFADLARDRGDMASYGHLSDVLRWLGRFDEALLVLEEGGARGAIDPRTRDVKTGRIEAARVAAHAKAAENAGEDALLPGTLAPGAGKKIAVVDLLFGWPPHGGAPRDIYEVFRHLAKTHHVRFILPAVKDGLMTRGRIEARLPFETQLVAMTPEEYTDATVGAKLRQAVDAFAPDAVFVGDGWAMKPAVVAALADYRPVVRFYAYEVACFRGAGERFLRGKPCPDSWLQTLEPAHHRRCIECCLDYFTQENPREAFFRRELVHSGAFEAGYPEFVARTLGKASAIVCYNQAMADILSRHNPATHVVPSGVDLARFAPVGPAEVTPRQILFAGRVYDAKKGFSWAVEACDLLAERGVEFTLLTTGVGKTVSRDYLKNVGWINDDAKLAGLMARSAVCLVPSLWPEALGMTAIEAMSCGRPVVASRTGGLGEIFTHESQGLYVEPGDVTGLADALQQLLENPDRGHAMGRAGRALAEERYDWADIAEKRIASLLFG